MSIERIPSADRAVWMKARHQDVTASVVGALFGEHPYCTPLELFMEKANETPPEEFDNAVLRRGRIFESAVAAAAAEDKKWEVEKDDSYYRNPEIRLGATPDYRIKTLARAPLQCKTVDPRVFERDWTPDEAPLWITLQALTEAMLLDAPVAYVGAIVMKRPYPAFFYEIPRNAKAEARIVKGVEAFWQKIAAKDMPAPNYARDGALLSALYAKGGGGEIDLTKNNRIGFLCEEKIAWARRKQNAERALETVDAEIVDILGNAERAVHPEFKITRKVVKRKGYEVAAAEYRDLRVTRSHAKPEEEAA